jgi:hypothetical protein
LRTLALPIFFRAAGLRVAGLLARADFRGPAMFNSLLFQPKTTTRLIGSSTAMRELASAEGVV